MADHTEGKIDGIVPEGALTPDSRLVLANAIYFYGGWLHTFDESATADDDFHLADGSMASVPFMYQQEELSYADAGDFQVVELPYQGSGFTFTVILPDEGQFDAVESGLDAATLDAALTQVASHKVDMYLPKFEFDSSASLAQTLAAMGMTDAFDPNAADFSGMLGAGAPEPLVISDVLHKAFISLDEEGTEAAAVTAVIMAAGAGAPSEEQPIEVRVDRPFLFLIRDNQTGDDPLHGPGHGSEVVASSISPTPLPSPQTEKEEGLSAPPNLPGSRRSARLKTVELRISGTLLRDAKLLDPDERSLLTPSRAGSAREKLT